MHKDIWYIHGFKLQVTCVCVCVCVQLCAKIFCAFIYSQHKKMNCGGDGLAIIDCTRFSVVVHENWKKENITSKWSFALHFNGNLMQFQWGFFHELQVTCVGVCVCVCVCGNYARALCIENILCIIHQKALTASRAKIFSATSRKFLQWIAAVIYRMPHPAVSTANSRHTGNDTLIFQTTAVPNLCDAHLLLATLA